MSSRFYSPITGQIFEGKEGCPLHPEDAELREFTDEVKNSENVKRVLKELYPEPPGKRWEREHDGATDACMACYVLSSGNILDPPNYVMVSRKPFDEESIPLIWLDVASALTYARSSGMLEAGFEDGHLWVKLNYEPKPSKGIGASAFERIEDAIKVLKEWHEKNLVHGGINERWLNFEPVAKYRIMGVGLAAAYAAWRRMNGVNTGLMIADPRYACPRELMGELSSPSFDYHALAATVFAYDPNFANEDQGPGINACKKRVKTPGDLLHKVYLATEWTQLKDNTKLSYREVLNDALWRPYKESYEEPRGSAKPTAPAGTTTGSSPDVKTPASGQTETNGAGSKIGQTNGSSETNMDGVKTYLNKGEGNWLQSLLDSSKEAICAMKSHRKTWVSLSIALLLVYVASVAIAYGVGKHASSSNSVDAVAPEAPPANVSDAGQHFASTSTQSPNEDKKLKELQAVAGDVVRWIVSNEDFFGVLYLMPYWANFNQGDFKLSSEGWSKEKAVELQLPAQWQDKPLKDNVEELLRARKTELDKLKFKLDGLLVSQGESPRKDPKLQELVKYLKEQVSRPEYKGMNLTEETRKHFGLSAGNSLGEH